jgi:hypothetical protein
MPARNIVTDDDSFDPLGAAARGVALFLVSLVPLVWPRAGGYAERLC